MSQAEQSVEIFEKLRDAGGSDLIYPGQRGFDFGFGLSEELKPEFGRYEMG